MVRSYRYNLFALLLWATLVATSNAQQANLQQPTPPGDAKSQATRIAIIYTDFFYDPNNEISRVVNAIKSLDQEFQPRKSEMQRLQQRIEQLTNETSGSSSYTCRRCGLSIIVCESSDETLQRSEEGIRPKRAASNQ